MESSGPLNQQLLDECNLHHTLYLQIDISSQTHQLNQVPQYNQTVARDLKLNRHVLSIIGCVYLCNETAF